MKSFVYFGTPYVASDTLEALLAEGYTPALVVVSPDRPQGRGLTLTPCPTRVLAESRGIPVLAPERIAAQVVEEISAYGAEYAIVVAYGKILPQSLIDAFALGVLNIHYSLLPKYRGASQFPRGTQPVVLQSLAQHQLQVAGDSMNHSWCTQHLQ